MKNLFSRFSAHKKNKRLLKPGPKTTRVWPIAVLFLAVAVILGSMFVSLTLKRAGLLEYSLPDLQVGDISSRRIIAPFDFKVPKPAEQLENERRRAAEDVLPVFNPVRTAYSETTAELDSLFSLLERIPESSLEDDQSTAFQRILSGRITAPELLALKRIIEGGDESRRARIQAAVNSGFAFLSGHNIVSSRGSMETIVDDLLMLEDGDYQRTIIADETIDMEEAGALFKEELAQSLGRHLDKSELTAVQNMAVRFIRPNLYYNEARTNQLRMQARQAVTPYSASYKQNERILEANVSVTATHIAALEAYREEMRTRSLYENRLKHVAAAAGDTLLAAGVLGIFFGYIFLYRRKLFFSFSKMLLLSIVVVIPIFTGYYAEWSGAVSEYLVPVAIASLLTTILFDAGLGVMISIAIALITSVIYSENGTTLAFMYFLGGGAGALTVGKVRHRKEFYRSMIVLPVVMATTVFASYDWMNDPVAAEVGRNAFLAAVNGFFCTIIAIGLLPVLETTFRIVTDITLLELSDLNNPLLKELAVKAPGTFSSVLMVGSLAEAAAEKIKANPLLSRVGAYYHDIGKIMIPEYFIENQMGGNNPHDRLTPHMSALVISSHVKEGYELGMQYGLPEAILDIIRQHHGTSLMASFYHKAKEQHPGEEIDESVYRYPGPKPQTREAGIVMLADLVEAASRAVGERTPNRLRTLIRTTIQKRFMEGELDECDLTLRDVHMIEESFLPVLVGSHHGRIAYPWQKKETAKEDTEETRNGEKKPREMEIKKE